MKRSIQKIFFSLFSGTLLLSFIWLLSLPADAAPQADPESQKLKEKYESTQSRSLLLIPTLLIIIDSIQRDLGVAPLTPYLEGPEEPLDLIDSKGPEGEELEADLRWFLHLDPFWGDPLFLLKPLPEPDPLDLFEPSDEPSAYDSQMRPELLEEEPREPSAYDSQMEPELLDGDLKFSPPTGEGIQEGAFEEWWRKKEESGSGPEIPEPMLPPGDFPLPEELGPERYASLLGKSALAPASFTKGRVAGGLTSSTFETFDAVHNGSFGAFDGFQGSGENFVAAPAVPEARAIQSGGNVAAVPTGSSDSAKEKAPCELG